MLTLTLSLVGGCRSGSRLGGSVPTDRPDPTQSGASTAGSFLALDDDRYGSYRAAPNAPHLGDAAPPIDLPDSAGGRFSLAEHEGPVMVMFYRGFW